MVAVWLSLGTLLGLGTFYIVEHLSDTFLQSDLQ